jgi:hypothetical protein
MVHDPELSKLLELQTKLNRICDVLPSVCENALRMMENDDLMQKRGIDDLMNS